MKIPYYTTRKAWPGSRERWGYWSPCLKRRNPTTGKIEPSLMAELGFKLVPCGPDGPDAWATAEAWNRRWKAARAAHRRGERVPAGGVPEGKPERERRQWPANSLGEAFAKFRATGSWLESKKPRTREDWWRGWELIHPVFGDLDPATVSFEQLDLWYFGSREKAVAGLLETVGIREAHRAMKIWRAMWKAVSKIKRHGGAYFCVAEQDPSLGIRRKTPKGRSLIWREGEVVRLVKGAIRRRKPGLAALLAVAWDSMLAPVDVRTLTGAQLAGDAEGPFYSVDRAKTGAPAIATLSRRTRRLLHAYHASLPFELHRNAPIFYTSGGVAGPEGGRPRAPVPYTANKLGQDFRALRQELFPGDPRTLGNDFRRSGAVEAMAGGVSDGALSAKMANTIDQSRELQRTYLPHQAKVVDLADQARVRGRAVLRGGKKGDGK